MTEMTHHMTKTSERSLPGTDTKKVLDSMLQAAVIAPSAHNTQPWQFIVKGDQLEVYVDQSRCLPASDPINRQAYLSVGCALMNCVVAAAEQEYDVTTSLLPDSNDVRFAARLTIKKGLVDEPLAQLATYIGPRRTDRSPYDGKDLTETEQQLMPTLHNSHVLLVSDKEQKDKIAALSHEGTFTALGQREFKNELAHWVRNNWTKQKDGMPGYATGIPAPLSLIAPLLVRILPLHKQEAIVAQRQISTASSIVVIVTAGDKPIDWLQSGMVMERLWLEATRAEVAVMPQTALIEGSAEVRQGLQQVLKSDRVPQAVLRMGHSTLSTRPRELPRRSVEDCLRLA